MVRSCIDIYFHMDLKSWYDLELFFTSYFRLTTNEQILVVESQGSHNLDPIIVFLSHHLPNLIYFVMDKQLTRTKV